MSIINIFESIYPRYLANIIFLYVKNEIKLKSFFTYKNNNNTFFFGDEIFVYGTNIQVKMSLKPYYTVDVTYIVDNYDSLAYFSQTRFDNLNKFIEFFKNSKYKDLEGADYSIFLDQKLIEIKVIDNILNKIYKMKLI